MLGLAILGCSSPTPVGTGSTSTGPGGGTCPTQTRATASYRSGWAPGLLFGGMAIYYPPGVESYGGVVVVPGFISPISFLTSWGPFFAQRGMAAFLVDPNLPSDFPDARSAAQIEALNSLKAEATRPGSPLNGRLDVNRLAVAGWSMGGGGTLMTAAANPPGVKAAVGWAPWNPVPVYQAARVPSMVLSGGLGDLLVGTIMTLAEYESIPATTPKAYYEWTAGHQEWVSPSAINGNGGTLTWAWINGFVNDVEECKALVKAGGRGAVNVQTAGF
jgi:hypothetical protein